MRILDVGLGWTARSGVVRATFLAPVVVCWLMLLFSRAGYRLHGVGHGMILIASVGVAWAGFVAWRVAMNEHVATARTSASDELRRRRR